MLSPDDSTPPDNGAPPEGEQPLRPSGLGSGLLARQPTPQADETIAVAKVCPQCGGEYETGDRFCPKDGTALRPKSGGDPLVGRVIADRYLILARLGEGGMGRVYLAEHVKMNRQCAVKVMNPSLMTDTESLQRFAREASSAARILHPNVAAVFDYGEADKIVYLVMEYVDGESLSTIIARDGRLEPRRAIDLARQIADGLHAAHELGIVHRDLKPDNVIVARTKSGKEVPKVVDFGIAKALTDSQEDALTRSGLVIGTPEYMSPEQLLGDPVDARADIYSLGCILYQMLTGEPAFAADSREQMIRRRLHEPPPHVRDVLPDLARRLDTLIVHMLARSPGDRLASAAEARDALDPALALGGWDPATVSDQHPQHPITSAGAHVPADPSLQPTMPMPKVRTSPKRIAIGLGIGAVVLFGGIGLWRLNQSPEKAGPNRTARRDSAAASALPIVVDTSNKKSLTAKSDSVKAAAKTAPKAVAPADDELAAPFAKILSAIRARNVDAVAASIPGFSQRDAYDGLLKNATAVHANAHYGAPNQVRSGVVERDVTLMVTTTDLAGANTVSPFHYRAVLQRQNNTWILTALTPK